MKKFKKLITIDDVIDELGEIAQECERENSTMGYFASLYRKVTIKVKEQIANNFFEDGQRMEMLDIIFAERYIVAYHEWKNDKEVTRSWLKAFEKSDKDNLTVLQHLLLGMNAHINLDLGIAAAEISNNSTIDNLENDFRKINSILSSLIHDVQNDLSQIWPFLKRILQWTDNADDFLIGFSMELARDGAWDFAIKVVEHPKEEYETLVKERDLKVAKKASIVTSPGRIASLILRIVRWGEKGNVTDKIRILQ